MKSGLTLDGKIAAAVESLHAKHSALHSDGVRIQVRIYALVRAPAVLGLGLVSVLVLAWYKKRKAK